ncbi:IS256 family transposase [Pseudomaricurvus alkylphenolicus]|uniref:IS256 family transposase n=1 Tax=Pseudomaricurvus alkylphenolicus TaxID=1306991 RepID=UPI00141D7A15|nr:IS256 family transposase [Pseudomaricurvus alkylphenolicus]NIB44919.1 IS256 family transposase [Pseudomaricurvus alkylphenolicus]
MSEDFDFDKALKAIQSGQAITGKDGVLAPLIKQLTEAALNAELEAHLEAETEPNRKNGKSAKTLRTTAGNIRIDTPRDRSGTFEPQLVRKNETSLSTEIENKILSLYGLGMSYSDINEYVEEMYGISVSHATITAVTDKIIDEVKQWQQRPLESHYPFVWLDAIHYKVKENGRYTSKAIYTVLALKMDGKKEVLGLYLSESEGANFWLSVLTDLQNRGVKDILIASVDGLTGFPEAIRAIFPQTEVQLCIVHQIRNNIRYVGWKNQRKFLADLKPVYRAVSKQAAEDALDALEEKWGEQYPIVIKSWRSKWDDLSAYFKYPEEIRRVIYTTNAVESVHRQFRKLTKTKGAFPNENSLLKLLYLGVENASKKWRMSFRNWGQTLSQLAIFFEGRLDEVIDL